MKRIGYLVLIFITLYVGIIYNSAAVIFLVGVELLLPLLLFLLLLAGNFLMKLSLVERRWLWDDGQALSLQLYLKKGGLLPLRQIRFRILGINETTKERYRQKVSLTAQRGENPPKELSLPALGYGVWHFSMKHLRVYDYLRLFWLPHPAGKDVSCMVLPKRYSIAVTGGVGAFGERLKYGGVRKPSWEYDRMNRGDLREYRPQDPLSEIHWKLSAKRDRLLVWERERRETGGWLLGLDLEGWSKEKAELVYSLMSGLYDRLDQGAVFFRRQEEEQMIQIQEEQDLYRAMELLMSGGLQRFGESFAVGGMEDMLWVREPLELWQGQKLLLPASDLPLEERLSTMELRL